MVVVHDTREEIVRVKDLDTGQVADVPESQVEMWPGRYVLAPKQKPSKRAASSRSATAEPDKKEEGDA